MKYTLQDGVIISAKEVAKKVGITVSGARHRLNRSSDPEIVFARPNETTNFNSTATVHTLSDGKKYTVRELRKLTGIKENTLRQRLKVSVDYNYVTRSLVFENLNAKIYIFPNGDEVTIGELSKARGCSQSAAYSLLENMNLQSRRARKQYQLDDGQYVNVEQVTKLTGVSKRTAKRRVQTSTDPRIVLAPRGTRHDKKYLLADGSTVTAKKVAESTGVCFERAKQRLRASNDPDKVFKPHYSKAKRVIKTTLFSFKESGLTKTTRNVPLGIISNNSHTKN